MGKLELHYVSNSGFTSETEMVNNVSVKEIVIFYFYFEWV
jgi:hypothetical protein